VACFCSDPNPNFIISTACGLRREDCYHLDKHAERDATEHDQCIDDSDDSTERTDSGEHLSYRIWKPSHHLVAAAERWWFTSHRLRGEGERHSCLCRNNFNQLHSLECL
jgi:hypothetical protein